MLTSFKCCHLNLNLRSTPKPPDAGTIKLFCKTKKLNLQQIVDHEQNYESQHLGIQSNA